MRKKSIVILSAISLIVTLVVSILGYLVIQRKSLAKKEDLSTETGENEVYKVAIEENEESKLNSMKIKEMNKNQSGVTIQQGNIVVHVDTTLKIDPSIAYYRTRYGIGEIVNIKVYFDKEIKEVKGDTFLALQFGSGNEKIVNDVVIDGSSLSFNYEIKEGDEGKLQLKNLSGTVSDFDGNSINIGLSLSGNVTYQDTTQIIADTTGKRMIMWLNSSRNNRNRIDVSVNYSNVYKKENGTIKRLDQTDKYKISKVGFQDQISGKIFEGKGEYINFNDDGITITREYYIGEGDNGIIGNANDYMDYCDIAGNSIVGYSLNRDIEDSYVFKTTQTPYVKSAKVEVIDENNEDIGSKKDIESGNVAWYLKEGKKIRVTVEYNENVYSKNGRKLKDGSVEITFINKSEQNVGGKKEAQFVSVNGKEVIYEYTIKEEDGISNESGRDIKMKEEIIIPENKVFDKVGHGNEAKTLSRWEQHTIEKTNDDGTKETIYGDIRIKAPYNIYIDTKGPTVRYDYNTPVGCYRVGKVIEGKFIFSEGVEIGNLVCMSSENPTERSAEDVKLHNYKELTYKWTVEQTDNGALRFYLNGIKDFAGNSIIEDAYYIRGTPYGIFTDNTAPTVKATSQNLGNGIVQYNFTLSDNSDSYAFYDSLDTNNKGLAQNTFTLDDIMISNGQIAKYTNDGKGNIQTIEVLSEQDGNQRIYIKAGTFSDVAGNVNDKDYIYTVDTKPPQIYSVEKSIDTWTNEDVQLTVWATDDGSGIYGYSIDDGENWQESNTYTIKENKEITIQVKDNQGNIASRTIEVNNIDKTVPTLNLTKTENNKESATITIKGSDNESGILKCSINGIDVTLKDGTYNLKVTENGNYIVTVYDKAGNSTTQKIEINNIDKTEKVDATIIYKNNGGNYTIIQGKSVNISEIVYVVNSSIEKIEYAWTQSEKQPTQWTNAGNTSGVKMEKEVSQEGSYYLYVKVTDKDGHETISHSNAFVVKLLKINLDESIDAKNINGVNYIILSKETKANELIGKITSNDNKYTIKIKNSDCTEDVTDNIKTGDVVVVEGEENYKLYKIGVKGDINKDGIIDVSDILQLNQYRLGKKELDEEQKIVADVDENNEININDIFTINKYRLGKIENF